MDFEKLDRVFISLGMSGRDDKEVEKDIERLYQLYKVKICKEAKCYHNLTSDCIDVPEDYVSRDRMRLIYLGRAIRGIGLNNINAIVFAKDWKQHKGCVIEHEVAVRYNIPYFVESEDSTRLIGNYGICRDIKYTYLAYTLVTCEMGSEGYSGWNGYTICQGSTIREVIEDYRYKNNSTHRGLKSVSEEYNIDTNCKDVEKFMVHDYFTTFFIRLEEEVYGHANPITIDFPYEKHKD